MKNMLNDINTQRYLLYLLFCFTTLVAYLLNIKILSIGNIFFFAIKLKVIEHNIFNNRWIGYT